MTIIVHHQILVRNGKNTFPYAKCTFAIIEFINYRTETKANL